jgi:hypothetical protein
MFAEPDRLHTGLDTGPDPRSSQFLLQASSNAVGQARIERGRRAAPDELVECSLLTRREFHRTGW